TRPSYRHDHVWSVSSSSYPHSPLLHRMTSFIFNYPSSPDISPLSLHDALPISLICSSIIVLVRTFIISSVIRRKRDSTRMTLPRSEEHTSELQSRFDLVCRLLLEKKK